MFAVWGSSPWQLVYQCKLLGQPARNPPFLLFKTVVPEFCRFPKRLGIPNFQQHDHYQTGLHWTLNMFKKTHKSCSHSCGFRRNVNAESLNECLMALHPVRCVSICFVKKIERRAVPACNFEWLGKTAMFLFVLVIKNQCNIVQHSATMSLRPKFHSKRMSAISTFSYTLVAAMLTPHQYADTCQASPSAAFAAGFWAQKWPARRANPDGLIFKIQKCYCTSRSNF